MPVPVDRLLLGVKWAGEVFVDGALPFGLRSAPKLFTAVADALLWVMGAHGLETGMHYLDDFLLLGPQGSEKCGRSLRLCLDVCRLLGVSVAPQKTEGPSTSLCFLGILLHTERMELRLPEGKLRRLQALVRVWKRRKRCPLLRRLIDLSTVAKKLHHHIHLNRATQSDLLWWDTFLGVWNGVSMMSTLRRGRADITLTSDTSGSWGGGDSHLRGHGFRCNGQYHGPPYTSQ